LESFTKAVTLLNTAPIQGIAGLSILCANKYNDLFQHRSDLHRYRDRFEPIDADLIIDMNWFNEVITVLFMERMMELGSMLASLAGHMDVLQIEQSISDIITAWIGLPRK
jgi:hypothetical protein